MRLLETMPCSDPPKPAELAACREWLKDFLRNEVRLRLLPQMEDWRQGDAVEQSLLTSAATGQGKPCSWWAWAAPRAYSGAWRPSSTTFDRARLEATHLTAARVTWHLERLWSLPLEQRKNIVGLPKNRADIILMGVAIYEAVMQAFDFPELRISTRGLRLAALLQNDPEPQRQAPAEAP